MPFEQGKSGNPNGRGVGARSKKTLAWEALAESITNAQSGFFNEYMIELWTSKKPEQRALAADLFLKTVEFFKPKQSRAVVQQEGTQQVEVVIKRKE